MAKRPDVRALMQGLRARPVFPFVSLGPTVVTLPDGRMLAVPPEGLTLQSSDNGATWTVAEVLQVTVVEHRR